MRGSSGNLSNEFDHSSGAGIRCAPRCAFEAPHGKREAPPTVRITARPGTLQRPPATNGSADFAPQPRMMRRPTRQVLRILSIAALALSAAVGAAPVRTAHVEAELVPAQTALVPGSPTTV